jgi:hypothetical protein
VGDSISDLLEWERVVEEARKAKTKEEIVTLLEKGFEERRRLCDEFAVYVDSVRYTGEGKHPLEQGGAQDQGQGMTESGG